MVAHVRIGQIMVARGLITQDQMESALEERGDSYERFGSVLVARGWVTEENVLECLAYQYGIPVVDLSNANCDDDALKLFSKTFANSRLILPVRILKNHLQCVVSDPLDYTLRDAIMAAHSLELDMALASPEDIRLTIEKAYSEMRV